MNVSNWKIGRKLAAGFAFLALVTVVVGGFAVVELRTIATARANLEAETAAAGNLRQARFYMARQENAFRGYLLSGDPYYVERLASHRENFQKNMAAAKAAHPPAGETQAQFDAATTAADAWYQLVNTEADRLIAGGDRAAAASFVGRDGPSDAAIGPAEEAVDALVDNVVAMREATNVQLTEAVQRGTIGLVLGAILSTIAAVVIGVLMTRAISRPLVALTGVMEKLASGNLGVEVGELRRQDEVGAMSRAVQVFKEQAIALEASSAAVVDGKNMMVGADRAMGIVEFDLSGNVMRANENFLKVMGYSLAEVQGRHHRMFCDRDYAASPEYAEMWRRLAAGEGFSDRFTRYARDGSKVVLDGRYNPIVGADGKPYKIVKFASDQTALELEREKRAERDAAAAREQAEVVNETASGLSALAAGDLAHRITKTFPGDYARLQVDFNAAMDKLEEAMAVIGTNASAMQSGAGEISQAADDLSRRTEQQAATLEETAAALDEITATVKRTAEGRGKQSYPQAAPM